MCGIAGILYFKEQPVNREIIEAMTQSMSHRGPDATGYYTSELISLGHKRLSIIDLDTCSNQPMSDPSDRYYIVFNGEIYNFRDVRNKTTSYPYSSNGDTETILAAFIKWGPSCLGHLDGMFVFAIWDTHKKELFVARDRLGVKPFYYYSSEEVFVFASEIRTILYSGLVPRRVNLEGISGFLQFQSVTQPQTIINQVYSLEAGTYMIVGPDRREMVKYWNIVNSTNNVDYSDEKQVKNRIRSLLMESVEHRMVSDVPVGAFLSGGIDSSAIVGLMASISSDPVNTFTVGFDEKAFDESYYANIIAQKFNTDHHLIKLAPSSFLEELLPALNAMDTPSGDGVNSYVVSKAICQTGIKVALSGVGGDELFAGYPLFRQYLKLNKAGRFWKLAKAFRELIIFLLNTNMLGPKTERYKQILQSPSCTIKDLYPIFRQITSPEMLRKCAALPSASVAISYKLMEVSSELEQFPLLSQVSIAEYLGYTSNTLLTDMDQMSMAVSLEVREPFFDHHLIEFVLNIPDNQKLPSYPKELLVESMGDLLPREIVHRKKQGFLFPWDQWMKKELKSFCEERIISISSRSFINGPELRDLWKRFVDNDPSVRWMEIWLFVVLEYWLSRNNVE